MQTSFVFESLQPFISKSSEKYKNEAYHKQMLDISNDQMEQKLPSFLLGPERTQSLPSPKGTAYTKTDLQRESNKFLNVAPQLEPIKFADENQSKKERKFILPSSSLADVIYIPPKMASEKHTSFDTTTTNATIDSQILPIKDDNDHITTVFGFPPSEVHHVIHYFQQLGEIINTEYDASSSGPSWVHIYWKSSEDASKALMKEGMIFNASNNYDHGQFMIGVIPYSKGQKHLPSSISIWGMSPKKEEKNGQNIHSIQTIEQQQQQQQLYEDNDLSNIFVPMKQKMTQKLRSNELQNLPVHHTPSMSILDTFLSKIFGN